MNEEENKASSASVVVALGLFMLGLWQWVITLGADKEMAATACLYNLAFAATALLLWWYFSPPRISTLAFFLAAAWPFWWPVLDNLITGYADPSTHFLRLSMQLNNAWYAKAWTRWLIELALVAFIFLGFRRRQR